MTTLVLLGALALIPASGIRPLGPAAGRVPVECALQTPATLEVGGQSLVKRAAAIRSALLGLVDLYVIAIYVPAQRANAAGLVSATVPKALWLGICYDDSAPSYIPISWRRELVPSLGYFDRERLRAEFASVRRGDIVTVAFDPNSGTRISIDGRHVVTAGGHALMAGFLDHWIGQVPVSQDVKSVLAPELVPEG